MYSVNLCLMSIYFCANKESFFIWNVCSHEYYLYSPPYILENTHIHISVFYHPTRIQSYALTKSEVGTKLTKNKITK